MGLAFLVAARNVGRLHVAAPYAADWKPLRQEGFGAYARRIARPYGTAMTAHVDPGRASWTERALGRVRG